MFLTEAQVSSEYGPAALLALQSFTIGNERYYWVRDVKKYLEQQSHEPGECTFIITPGEDKDLPHNWTTKVAWSYCKRPVAVKSYCQEHWNKTHYQVKGT